MKCGMRIAGMRNVGGKQYLTRRVRRLRRPGESQRATRYRAHDHSDVV
jgi:hypothetical protein